MTLTLRKMAVLFEKDIDIEKKIRMTQKATIVIRKTTSILRRTDRT